MTDLLNQYAIWRDWQAGTPVPDLLRRYALDADALTEALTQMIREIEIRRAGLVETFSLCAGCRRSTNSRYGASHVQGRYLCAPCAVAASVTAGGE